MAFAGNVSLFEFSNISAPTFSDPRKLCMYSADVWQITNSHEWNDNDAYGSSDKRLDRFRRRLKRKPFLFKLDAFAAKIHLLGAIRSR